MVDGARASAWDGSGIATDEGEGVVLVFDGEVLGADGGDAVEIGEIVDDEVAGFSGRDFVSGFGIEDEVAAPGREAMVTIWPGGIGLAGELGHAVFVVEVVRGEIEEGGEFAVEFRFGERM